MDAASTLLSAMERDDAELLVLGIEASQPGRQDCSSAAPRSTCCWNAGSRCSPLNRRSSKAATPGLGMQAQIVLAANDVEAAPSLSSGWGGPSPVARQTFSANPELVEPNASLD